MNHDNDFEGLYDSSDFMDKEFEQVKKIRHRLDKGEQVQFIARQSKHRPGGSFTTPYTIFVTNKRIVIRNPSLLGVRENIVSVSYDKITSIELERGVFFIQDQNKGPGFADEIEAISKKGTEQIVQYVKNSMDKIRIESQKRLVEVKESVADELLKLANLRKREF